VDSAVPTRPVRRHRELCSIAVRGDNFIIRPGSERPPSGEADGALHEVGRPVGEKHVNAARMPAAGRDGLVRATRAAHAATLGVRLHDVVVTAPGLAAGEPLRAVEVSAKGDAGRCRRCGNAEVVVALRGIRRTAAGQGDLV
jgi:hypothetical protein